MDEELKTDDMKYYSTNKNSESVSLRDAVIKGLAPDKGLYMPEVIKQLPPAFFHNMKEMSLREISFIVAEAFFGEDVDAGDLKKLVDETLNFDIPLVKVSDRIYSLELFHGPTLAFKDVGARFMARLLGYFMNRESRQTVNVLVATSGDTGSAVANGFLDVPGIKVYVLYPKDKVSKIQEMQFATLGKNITALEVDGTFDDCQSLVKKAFLDKELNEAVKLTSANSINVARFLPQSFYYFYAYAQLAKEQKDPENLVFSVPSGNFGNITAGLFAKRMGLPVKRFIAANNRNDIFLQYLRTGRYEPRPSVTTIANAMDVGDPSNFARVLDLYGSHEAICKDVSGASYTDEQIRETLARVLKVDGYLLDPHGTCGYRALEEGLQPDETGIFLETAHPSKFLETVKSITGAQVVIPLRLQEFMLGSKQSLSMPVDFGAFKHFLMNQNK